MIITRTPFRISFFGGGTDYPAYYRQCGGSVISTTIDKYCYIMCRHLPPFFDYRYRVRYTKREETKTIDEIQHPSVRECLRFMGVTDGIEMVHSSDIPAMSGVGSSSAFTVGFLRSLYALRGEMVTKKRLAMDAIHVEQNLIGEAVGSQDQVAAAFGGFNHIEFTPDDGIHVQPLAVSQQNLTYLQSCLLFVFTGYPRYASEIAKEQINETPNSFRTLERMREMVAEATELLNGRPDCLDDFGRLLHDSWLLKRSLTKKITNFSIDQIYERAISAGAIGGKLCGAGGGGFLLLFAPPDIVPLVRRALGELVVVPFRFESLGSDIVLYSPNDAGVQPADAWSEWDARSRHTLRNTPATIG
jgi:D-glycero-alpha-D-manno-heptose-7-phosphate kinase